MTERFAIDLWDGARGSFIMAIEPSRIAFVIETLRPNSLLAAVSVLEGEGETGGAYAVFDTDRHLFDVRITDGEPVTGPSRAVYAALLAAVWAPARTRVFPFPAPEGGAVTAQDVQTFVRELGASAWAELCAALHEAGFGHDPPGRSFRAPERESELKWCAMQTVLRAVAAAESAP